MTQTHYAATDAGLHKALAACKADGGGTIEVEDGTYSGTFDVPAGVTIQGARGREVLMFTNALVGLSFRGAGTGRPMGEAKRWGMVRR